LENNIKVALVNPPFLPMYSRGQRSPAVTRSGTLYYPMWLAYAAAHVRKCGAEPLLLDAVATDMNFKDAVTRLNEFKPDIALVEVATPSSKNDLNFAAKLKQICPRTLVFACGTHVSALPRESLKSAPQIDGAVIGEYEIPLEEMISALKAKRSLQNLEGVCLKNGVPELRSRFLESLDERPYVAEIYNSFLPIEKYFNPNAHHPMVTILTGRGCPYSCRYCVFPQTMTGHKYRKRSIDSVIAEIEWVAHNMPHVKGIFMEDDTFTADKQRVREFCGRLESLRLRLSWTANARADVDYETLIAMKKSNLRALCVGFESGNQKILDEMGKGITLSVMEKFAEDAVKAGVKVHGCFMVGLPGETRLSVQETLQFALRLPLDTAQFYPLMVYPGTYSFAWAKSHGMLTADDFRDWLSPEGLHQCVIRTEDLSSRQLVKFCNYARRRFYLRKSYLLRQAGKFITDADERTRLIKSAKIFLAHLFLD